MPLWVLEGCADYFCFLFLKILEDYSLCLQEPVIVLKNVFCFSDRELTIICEKLVEMPFSVSMWQC